jgi:tetratricopeptide (TPR) repeat protein
MAEKEKAQDKKQEPDVEALRAELVRVRIKRSESTDADIIAALDARIAELEKVVPAKVEEVEEPLPEPATPQQLAAADRLVRQSRVEKMRNNKKGATDCLRQAAEIAPGAPSLHEALGDDLMERGMLPQAKAAYKRAWRLDPTNVSLERKYAISVTRIGALGNLDDQMRRALSDSPFTDSDRNVSRFAVIALSAVVPGLGHLVLGRTAAGVTVMATWFGLIAWISIKYRVDLFKLLSLATGKGVQPNLAVLFPIAVLLIVYIGTLASLKGPSQGTFRKRVEHPAPPVNLPFE